MRRFYDQALPILVLIVLLIVLGVADAQREISNQSIDVSWPNCKQLPGGYSRGIIGATGGLDFRMNPCLNKETALFSSYALYMNSGYPGEDKHKDLQNYPLTCISADITCHAFNYGYNAAVYAIRQSAHQGGHSLTWWIDVETDNSWSADPAINRANLDGMVAAIKKNVFLPKIGFYSYPGQWQQITGNWHNAYPAWIATGQLKYGDAVRACALKSFNGGAKILAQYTGQLDINVPCSEGALKNMPI